MNVLRTFLKRAKRVRRGVCSKLVVLLTAALAAGCAVQNDDAIDQAIAQRIANRAQ